jgi:YegS/Rv2252/BmrU family lipid kinase
MEQLYDWFVIVNPHANAGKALKQWNAFSAYFDKHQISYYAAITQSMSEAQASISKAIDQGYYRFAIVGGDGTLHHFINQIMLLPEQVRSRMYFGILPVGTGNDFLKSMKLSSKASKVIARFKKPEFKAVDIGLASYADGSVRYFLNMAGAGFDALVAKDVNISKAKGNGGILVYFKYLIKHLFSYKPEEIKIKAKEYEKTSAYLTVLIGNGSYAGGGMLLVPGAKPDDGLFHITLIKKISPWKVIFNIYKLYSGNILQIKQASQLVTKELYLSSTENVPVQLDGEDGGHLPVKLSIQPLAIKIVVAN